ncbi:MAG: nucleotidyltransferase substrate binding protein [Planctomycetaceae bacterium]|jgi:nucleotidyltransferase substrate binding protein (TIGR01987 family)|nr:nucleotidyltransferase substrate binding protein [Planctomycetaceae bacterium]
MKLNTVYFSKSINVLEHALKLISETDTKDITYVIYRSACIKEYEIILEQSVKLLRKALKPYFSLASAVDKLTFKDVLRHAVLRGIITVEESEQWMQYRDSRNTTVHDYGDEFAETTLSFFPQFIKDAKRLCDAISALENL